MTLRDDSPSSLAAARAALEPAPVRGREPAWRPLAAGLAACIAALGLCAVVFANGPPDIGASDGAPGLRQALAR